MLNNQSSESITLDSLSALTGFPVDMIKKELFESSEINGSEEIPLEKLRSAMMSLIDETMLDTPKKELN